MENSSILSIVKAISDVFPQEASIAIADKSKFIYYQPSRAIDLKIKPGDDIHESTLTSKALTRKQRVEQYLENSVFGVPYYAMSTPILNEGNAEGCITAIFPPTATPGVPKLPRHHFLIGKGEDRWVPIPLHEIHFIESDKGKTYLYTERGVYVNKYSLVELERILPSDLFVRCHRAYMVNVYSIAEIHPDFHSTFMLIMNDAARTRVPVSQKYASSFRRLLGF
ncbi:MULTISPECIES: LytTR family DNA-binding domain-containing protein [Aneurinibacillus]|jgi:DNA-binding LytR/AlgR family response regulator|uniref:LytR family transcriptional regulator n=1 Tax=Aneurinibacillus danicus TaxID=267746 RepID=A0A511V821_9BACL|nr:MULTISPECIES: LytTR family DNA-binding domain-containing protein [Aneurinibacillus]GEN34048.1 LytR family transcriptional regulator [Aneurinibacillus danicus]